MLLTVVLSWSLAHTCPLIESYRRQGYSDEQIEQGARERHVPEWIITLAKKHCTR